MNWLFYILLVFVAVCMMLGAKKGFVKTAVSMVFMILVMVGTSWLNPYVGKFLREKTPVYTVIQKQCEEVVEGYIDKKVEDENPFGDETPQEFSSNYQEELLEEAPLPEAMRQYLLDNNNSDIYEILGVNAFADYIANYIAYGITNGIAYLLSFALAIIIIKVILYALNILTALPGVGLINTLGGLILGCVQGILWIWVFFVIITVLCNTWIGKELLGAIEDSAILSYLYDKNQLLKVIMAIVS